MIIYQDAHDPLYHGYYISTHVFNAPDDAVAITVSGDGSLYRLRANGTIELFQTNPTRWLMLDNNPATIAIAAGRDSTELYQLHSSGWIWHYTQHPCQGTVCDGWERLDDNPATVRIVATAGELYQLHNNGSLYRYIKTPCSGDSCPGWEMLLHDSVGGIAADGSLLYEINGGGAPHASAARLRFLPVDQNSLGHPETLARGHRRVSCSGGLSNERLGSPHLLRIGAGRP